MSYGQERTHQPHRTRSYAGTYYEGVEDRGIRLEVITVPRERHELAFHSMPTSQRHDHQED